MNTVLDMRFIRYVNLFNRITRVNTNHCFEYNNTIIFVVPKKLIMKSIGENNKNLETLSRIIGKRIKIVPVPRGMEDMNSFISLIVKPVRFKSVEVKEGEAIINAHPQNKASLIGKGKVRLDEMENILGQYFGIRKVRIK